MLVLWSQLWLERDLFDWETNLSLTICQATSSKILLSYFYTESFLQTGCHGLFKMIWNKGLSPKTHQERTATFYFPIDFYTTKTFFEAAPFYWSFAGH